MTQSGIDNAVNLSERQKRIRTDVILALLMGLWCLSVLLAAWYRQPLISRDGAVYLLSRFDLEYSLSTAFSPCIAAMIRWAGTLGLDPEKFVISLNIVAVSVSGMAIYGISRLCFKQRIVAVVAALLFSLNPTIVKNTHMVQRESLFLLGLCVSVFLLFLAFKFDADRPRFKFASIALSGFFCAFGLFSRLEILEWWLLANALVLFGFWGKAARRQRLIDAGVFNLAFLVGLILLLLPLRVSPAAWEKVFRIKIEHYLKKGTTSWSH